MAAVSLFIDEDVHAGLAAALRRQGIDAVNAHECGRKEAKDSEQLAFAVAQQRAFMTFNLADFEELASQYFWQNKQHFGIIVSPQRTLRETLRRLVTLTKRFNRESLVNQLIYL
jgi:predicted nuclease of predicted toxin-antitoxin system